MHRILSAILAISVTTGSYTNSRTNANTVETVLTPANVAPTTFGFLANLPVDDTVWAQPLVGQVSAAPVFLLFTASNTAYLYSGTAPFGLLWSRSLGSNSGITGGFSNNRTATPVIDPATNLVYMFGQLADLSFKIWCLNLADGTDAIPAVTVAGTSNGITFSGAAQWGRPSLTLANSNIYLEFGCGNIDETSEFQGWVFAYSASALSQVGVFATVNGSGSAYTTGGAGIWMGSVGPIVDGSGNLIMLTGNGAWDGVSNFGESFIKLSPSLALLDWFTPSNWAALNAGDLDLGAGHAVLLPGGAIVIGGGKVQPTTSNAILYVLNESNLGHLEGSGGSAPIQKLGVSGGIRQGIAFANNSLYISDDNSSGAGGKIKLYPYNGTTFGAPTATSPTGFGYPGATITYSSNGSGGGIIWAIASTISANVIKPGALYAYDASTLAELWNSSLRSSTNIGQMQKYAVPTVANGMVLVPTASNQVVIFGLTGPPPSVVLGQGAFQ